MPLPEIYSPVFTAATGDDMTGNASPEKLTAEFTALSKFFDPGATHDSGNAGGIHKGNLATNSGILTTDTATITANLTGNVTGNVTGNLTGNVTGNVTGNSDTATTAGTCSGNAATATKLSGVIVSAYRSASYSYNIGDTILFDTEVLDTKNKYDPATGRCTPGVGTYLVSGYIQSNQSTAQLRIMVNTGIVSTGVLGQYSHVSDLINITNEADYISFRLSVSATITNGRSTAYFSIVQIA